MPRAVRVLQILYHAANISAAPDGTCSRTKAVYFMVWTRAPYPSLFSLMYKYQLIFRYRVRTKRSEESLWFGLRLFLNKCWGQHLYPIGTNKQNNMNQILLHLEVLRDSFSFHESHTFHSTFPLNKKKLYLHLHMPYRVGGLVICKCISCLFKTNHELCINVWLYTYS
jgi:hypothetical protein